MGSIATTTLFFLFWGAPLSTSEIGPAVHELPTPAYRTWQTLHEQWNRGDRWRCLRRFRQRPNCSTCERVMLRAVFTIDGAGKLSKITILRESYCRRKGNPRLQRCLLRYWRRLTYPQPLRNRQFRVALGVVLKC